MKKTGTHSFLLVNRRGITLIELMVVLAIFSVVMAGMYSSYTVLMKQGFSQYKLAQSEMEFQIAKSVIERDIAMAGSGIANIYCESTVAVANTVCTSGSRCSGGASDGLCVPIHLRATPNLIMMGTALGRESRASQAWSLTTSNTPTVGGYRTWTDAREQLRTNSDLSKADKIIYIEPNKKRLLYHDSENSLTGRKWLFPYPGSATTNPYPTMGEDGMLVFGMTTSTSANLPFYMVQYSLGGTAPSNCAPGSSNLLRLETHTEPLGTGGQPLMNCVLGFQVALGLATNIDNNDPRISCWDLNGAACAAGYPSETLRKQLKQVKVFVLAQEGKEDLDYTYGTNPVTVGDETGTLTKCIDSGVTCMPGAGVVGQSVTLNADQLHYRWKLLTLEVAPRNIR